MNKPSKLQNKLAAKLFEEASEQASFLDHLHSGESRREAIIWLSSSTGPFRTIQSESWQTEFVEQLEPGQNPGASEFHQSGDFYCLDFSSVACASVIQAIRTSPTRILDICSAPGGKAIFAKRLFPDAYIVCNEVINKRIPALISNLKRCRIAPSAVSSLDVSSLASRYESAFDLVLVDAPCSGQSLLVKGKPSPGAFHPSTINLNANRQKRIIANAANCVAPGGYLAYMTCTFSIEENEKVVDWFIGKFPSFESIEIAHLKNYQSKKSNNFCYKLFPQNGLGTGGFTTLFQLRSDGDRKNPDFKSEKFLWKQE